MKEKADQSVVALSRLLVGLPLGKLELVVAARCLVDDESSSRPLKLSEQEPHILWSRTAVDDHARALVFVVFVQADDVVSVADVESFERIDDTLTPGGDDFFQPLSDTAADLQKKPSISGNDQVAITRPRIAR